MHGAKRLHDIDIELAYEWLGEQRWTHGGIRAMQRGVPTLVLSIDNRAREIARSVGLRAPSRNAARRYREDLRSGEVVRIDVPRDAVDSWRARWGIGS